LGDLNINFEAVAPYTINQRESLMGAPAVTEQDADLPQDRPGLSVQIPLEMMPSEAQALRHFSHFFTHIYPYAPVINRAAFYHQWRFNRESLSPLLLEAIFACSLLTQGDINQGSRWLALASSEFFL